MIHHRVHLIMVDYNFYGTVDATIPLNKFISGINPNLNNVGSSNAKTIE